MKIWHHSRLAVVGGLGTSLRLTGVHLNTLRQRQNGRHFAGDIFKRIFFNENVWISIKISLKFVPKGPINKIPALFQIMAWRRPGDKPLSEAMLVSSLTHKCVTRPQWVNPSGTEARIFWNNLVNSQQHGCWYPGSWHCQAINRHDIESVWQTACFPWGKKIQLPVPYRYHFHSWSTTLYPHILSTILNNMLSNQGYWKTIMDKTLMSKFEVISIT